MVPNVLYKWDQQIIAHGPNMTFIHSTQFPEPSTEPGRQQTGRTCLLEQNEIKLNLDRSVDLVTVGRGRHSFRSSKVPRAFFFN